MMTLIRIDKARKKKAKCSGAEKLSFDYSLPNESIDFPHFGSFVAIFQTFRKFNFNKMIFRLLKNF